MCVWSARKPGAHGGDLYPRRASSTRGGAGRDRPCFVEKDGATTDIVVLACTHYPFMANVFRKTAPWPVDWLDPAEAIARRALSLLKPAPEEGGLQRVVPRQRSPPCSLRASRILPPSGLCTTRAQPAVERQSGEPGPRPEQGSARSSRRKRRSGCLPGARHSRPGYAAGSRARWFAAGCPKCSRCRSRAPAECPACTTIGRRLRRQAGGQQDDDMPVTRKYVLQRHAQQPGIEEPADKRGGGDAKRSALQHGRHRRVRRRWRRHRGKARSRIPRAGRRRCR